MIIYASKDQRAGGTVESARESPGPRAVVVRAEDALPRNQSGQWRTRKRSNRRPIALLAVVIALAMAASPSSGMSETTPPHTAGPAPEISTADALKKGDEALHRKDYARALHWYRQAADQGVLEAQNNIGRLYANGWGVIQDYSEAMRWFRQAADQGYAGADYNVGN